MNSSLVDVHCVSKDDFPIHRKKKDGGCTFYHNTWQTKLSRRRHMERYGLMAVVPTLTALLLSSLNDFQFFFVFLYALLEFSCAKALWVNVPVAIFFPTADWLGTFQMCEADLSRNSPGFYRQNE